jgi:hypothetical protein
MKTVQHKVEGTRLVSRLVNNEPIICDNGIDQIERTNEIRIAKVGESHEPGKLTQQTAPSQVYSSTGPLQMSRIMEPYAFLGFIATAYLFYQARALSERKGLGHKSIALSTHDHQHAFPVSFWRCSGAERRRSNNHWLQFGLTIL